MNDRSSGMTQQQYRLAWEGHWIYRKLFPWYGDAYLKAKSSSPPWRPPVFDPAMHEITARADREWTERTGLPALDACDPETWWTAAIAAGMHGQPVENVRSLSVRELAEIILPWALAKSAAIDQAEYLKVRTSDAARRYNVTSKAIRDWRDNDRSPKRIKSCDCRGYVLVHPEDWET